MHLWKSRGLGNFEERKHSEDLDVDERILLKLILRKQDAAWIGLMQVRLGVSGGPLWTL